MAKQPPKITVDTPIGEDVDLERAVVRDKQGRRITTAYADRLAEAARKPGRPSLARSGTPSIAFRLPEELRDQAEALAKREGKTGLRPRARGARGTATRQLRQRRSGVTTLVLGIWARGACAECGSKTSGGYA